MLIQWMLKGAALLVIVFPGFSFAQSAMEVDEQSLLSAFVSYTDLRISDVQQSLDILASTAEAKSVDWEEMKALLDGYQQANGGSLIVWFLRPDGTYYTVNNGLMKVKLSDRGYFPELMSGRKVVGSVVVSKSTGKRSAIIAVPIQDGNKVVGAIGASLFLDGLADQVGFALASQTGMGFFALTTTGQIALEKMSGRNLPGPRELGSEAFKQVTDKMLANSSGETHYVFANVAKRVIYRTSPLTQWKFAITFSTSQQK